MWKGRVNVCVPHRGCCGRSHCGCRTWWRWRCGVISARSIVSLSIGGHILVVFLSAFFGHLLVALFYLGGHICPPFAKFFGNFAYRISWMLAFHFKSFFLRKKEIGWKRLFWGIWIFLFLLRFIGLEKKFNFIRYSAFQKIVLKMVLK